MATIEALVFDLRTAVRSGDPSTVLRIGLRIRESLAQSPVQATNAMYKRIFDLMCSLDPWDKLAGLAAIDALTDADTGGEGDLTSMNRFANYIRLALPGQIEPDVSQVAARVLGRLVKSAGTLATDLVEFEITRALEWLQGDRNESRRYAAVLIIRELSINSSTIIYSYLQQILDHIWTGLRDPKLQVRETAADALGACLKVMVQRESHQHTQWYTKVYAEASKGILSQKQTVNVDTLHGSLLALREMLRCTASFMANKYPEASELILHNRDNKDILVRKTVISLCSTLASFDTPTFLSMHFNTYIPYLLGQLRREKDILIVNRAFATFGEIAVVVESAISPYLEVFLKIVKESLTKSKSRSNDSAVFQAIGNVAKAVGPTLTKYMHEVLDVLFALGLTESLCRLMSDLCLFIPPLRSTIQDRLLDLLSYLLCGEKYQHLAMVKKLPRDFFIAESQDPETVLLALNALGTFEFTDHSLLELVREIAALYFYDESVAIRKAAALTCCKLLVRDPINYLDTEHGNKVVNGVVERLLVVGITDLDYRIRRAIISAIDVKLDHRLIQPNNIQSIFAALNDEDFAIREMAVAVIGRLSMRCPAGVMPLLRQAFIQFLTEIQYSGVSHITEKSAKLLAGLIASSHHLVKPYVPSILKVLLPKAKDPNPNISSKIIMAICELSRYGNLDFLPYIDEILDILVEAIKDQTSTVRREAALRTLGQLSTNVGIVITPYQKYPELLELLMDKFKSEQSAVLRRETVTVVGLLGALDPYRTKRENESSVTIVQDTSFQSIPVGPSSDEYYPMVAINSLMKILQDVLANHYHASAVQAVILIFEKSGPKCFSLLPTVMPPILAAMKIVSATDLEFYVGKLAELTLIVKRHIRPYLNEIFAMIKEFWNVSAGFQISALGLLDAIAGALQSDLKVFLPPILPQILQIFELDSSENKYPIQRVLESLVSLNSSIDEHLHLIIPIIAQLFENQGLPLGLRRYAIQVAGHLSKNIKFNQSSRIIHPLIRVINGPHAELKMAAMDTLSILAIKLGPDFTVFIPMINKIMARNNMNHVKYNALISKILKNEKLPDLQDVIKERVVEFPREDEPVKKLEVDMPKLKRSWDTSNKTTKAEWAEWMRRLSVELLKESPQFALRACSTLAAVYPPLCKELFNVGFVSCWWELYDQFQDDLVQSISSAINSSNFPPDMLQTLLNLAEFMERDENKKPLPIARKTLGQYAARSHAWAKALYYKESEFLTDPTPETVETLIGIYNQLQQPDSAVGILRRAHENHNVELISTWYEKLNRWEDGLAAHERKALEDPDSFEALHGRMRCLEKMGEWEALSKLAQEAWTDSDDDTKRIIAPLAASGAWGIGEWTTMEQYVKMITSETFPGAYYRAILFLHRSLFPQASFYIERARELLDSELMAVSGESYSRAYSSIVKVQMLVELEEIIKYKRLHDCPERQTIIRNMWMERLKGCQEDAEIWNPIIRLRELVISPKVEPEMWIRFAEICRKTKRMSLSFRALSSVVNSESTDLGMIKVQDLERNPPKIIFACLTHVWDVGSRESEEHAITQMRKFASSLAARVDLDNQESNDADPEKRELAKLLSKCYLKLGQWTLYLHQNDLKEENIADMLRSFSAAAKLNKSWYSAWDGWAVAYTYIIKHYEKANSDRREGDKNLEFISLHVVPAINSFFHAIALSKTNSLQDTLRLLTTWFKYGHEHEVNSAVAEGCGSVSVDTWLQVIPQLIARIHSHSDFQRLVHKLLSDVGKEHPQALVYSITVASKSQSKSESRKNAAVAIMDRMRTHSANLIEQVLVVSEELIRVAILWLEAWHGGLEEASQCYYNFNDVDGMMNVLDPLHKSLEMGPETLKEVSFYQAYGRDLLEAYDWCKSFKVSKNVNDMNQAWDLYYKVFRKIHQQLPQLTTLDLSFVSPKLVAATDLELAVPGTYKSGDPIVKILSFEPMLKVMQSKARPRRLTIKGADGVDYQYLLKGHDDMRQDERVMQLFGLVNTLLKLDAETFQRQLSIKRYTVTPLSENSGLIGFVPNCDTLNQIIKDYRESRKIILNIESKLMSEMNPNRESLTLLQKVEIFEYAMNKTDGKDLYKMLWLRSKNSEVWLDRRTNYTRSLALMSMVGYILGLGDRHPNNLMIDRFTGQVVHIDFGDCFESAMDRDKFPEKVPFRLTRMLVNAMEVSGIEGNFRITCEHVMRVLREHKSSVMSVLEAFVHDPLIYWRLFDSPKLDQKKNITFGEDGAVGNDVNVENLDNLQSARYMGSRKFKSLKSYGGTDYSGPDDQAIPEAINSRAMKIVSRVEAKLTGMDFKTKSNTPLDIESQVDRLILQATSTENLCQNYVGWSAYW
ncbi:phosphatidylinositol kinase- protein kinase tor1 [Rhizoclosmatium sp. JEL0117]|nr:phosphatidylinositol kinase- protein kinase tor1 [Rhizoclosmatium sp. JEL0117]